MAPKIIGFGAKTRRQKKNCAKAQTRRQARRQVWRQVWHQARRQVCHGAKLSAPSRTLQLCCTGLAYDCIGPAVMSYKSLRPALAYGSTLSAYCCKGASIWLHLASISLPGTSISLPRACISQHHVIILHILMQMASIFMFGAHIYY